MPKDIPQVDHRAEALRLLEEASKIPCDLPEFAGCIQEAQVHSNLAIAEGQERVAGQLGELRREMRDDRRRLSADR
jgi:hypothetical protein